jgi:probable HAF family extracellular repeat protein
MKLLPLFLSLVGTLPALGLKAATGAMTDAQECVAPRYKIIVLPLQPSRLNDSAQVAGNTEDHAAIWSLKEGLRELRLPPGFNSARASGLNNAGEVVGQATKDGSNQVQAFEYSKGDFFFLSDSQSKAVAINNAGEIAGESGQKGPTVWNKRVPVDVGGCCGGRAAAINNQGQVIGDLYDRQGRYRAFLWDSKRGIHFLGPPDSYSSALAINDVGHIIVQAFSRGVLLFEDGAFTRLQLSDSANEPRAVNSCDAVVGAFGPSSDYYRAFVWDKKHGFRDLNRMVDGGSDWILEVATDINNRGEIVGVGMYRGKGEIGFLLLPQQ